MFKRIYAVKRSHRRTPGVEQLGTSKKLANWLNQLTGAISWLSHSVSWLTLFADWLKKLTVSISWESQSADWRNQLTFSVSGLSQSAGWLNHLTVPISLRSQIIRGGRDTRCIICAFKEMWHKYRYHTLVLYIVNRSIIMYFFKPLPVIHTVHH